MTKFFDDRIYRKVAIGIGGLVAVQLIIMISILPGVLLLSAVGVVDLKSILLKPLSYKQVSSTLVPSPSRHISDAFLQGSVSSASSDSVPHQIPDHLTEASLVELGVLLNRLALDSTAKSNFGENLKSTPLKHKGNSDRVVPSKLSVEQTNNNPIDNKDISKPETIKLIKNTRKSYSSVIFSIFFSSISYVGLATFFYSWLLDQKKQLGILKLIITKNLVLDINRLSFEVASISKSFSPEGLDALRTDLSSLQEDMTKISEIQNKQEEIYKKLEKDTTDFPFIAGKYLTLRQKFDRVTRDLTPDSSSPSISPLSSASSPCFNNSSATESPSSISDDASTSKNPAFLDSLKDDKIKVTYNVKETASESENKSVKDNQPYSDKRFEVGSIQPLNQTRMSNLKLHSLPNRSQLNSFETRHNFNIPLNHQRIGRYNGRSNMDLSLNSSYFQDLGSKYGNSTYRLSQGRSDRLTNTQRNGLHNIYIQNSTLPKVTRLSPNTASVIKTLGSSSNSPSQLLESTLHPQFQKSPLISEKSNTPDLISGAADGKESLSASLSVNQLENKTYPLSDNSTKKKLLKTEFGTFDISTDFGRKEWMRAMNTFNNQRSRLKSPTEEISSAPMVLGCSSSGTAQQLADDSSPLAFSSSDSGCESARIEFLIPKNTNMSAMTIAANALVSSLSSPSVDATTAVDSASNEPKSISRCFAEELLGSTAVEESTGDEGKIALGPADKEATEETERVPVVFTLEEIKAKLDESEKKNYRRLFLPGRGWVSVKKLQEEAIAMEQNKTETSQIIPGLIVNAEGRKNLSPVPVPVS